MILNREEIFKKYMIKVNEISDKCDWKTHFSPYECVDLVCKVIEEMYEKDNNDIS